MYTFTITAFGDEIPAFAGMELKRFRLSPEWRFFIFSDTAKFGIVRKDKKHRHSGESLSSRTRGPESL
ncbi:MAG: hypothetical protein ACR2QC_08370 [Gammaproteobacteria bacterium]